MPTRGKRHAETICGRAIRQFLTGILAVSAVVTAVTLVASPHARAESDGVKVPSKSMFRNLVSAEDVEKTAAAQYAAMRDEIRERGKLLDAGHPLVTRVRRIAEAILPHTQKFNERAKDWEWEINVFDSPTINAFCMPGGKIGVYSGLVDRLQLTDDEIAMIVGHEMGHALWEHARERSAKTTLTDVGSRIVGRLLLGDAGELIGVAGASLAALKYSRNDETEADLIGMELAARAGYDPRAGITLWQKMSKAAKGAPPQWLSTHPSGSTRIKTIEDNLKDVMPLYERAKRS
ncbi:MAG: M48 family metallopeptidase [Hyphomicrobium sp.]|nr:M48 family metallopeptidase [Hyphomicrobium sp.]